LGCRAKKKEKEMMKEEDLIISDTSVRHTLDLLIREKRFELGTFAYKNLRVERIPSYGRRELIYSLYTLIPSENLKEETHTVSVEYPASWWQMFKERYYPLWWKKKHQIKQKTKSETVTFTAYNLYPKFPDVAPERCIDAVQTIIKSVDYGAEDQ